MAKQNSFNYTKVAAHINAHAIIAQVVSLILFNFVCVIFYRLGLFTFHEITIWKITFSENTIAFFSAGFVLLLEAIIIIRSSAITGAYIRKKLAPLQELLSATEAFAEASRSPSGRFSPEALKELARALDAVNASQLDSRIAAETVAEELRPLASAINEMLERIDEAYGAQKRFVSDASHELRTPIAVIQGYANMLLRWGSEDPDTLRESIVAIKTEAEAMKQMVNQLLFLARGDNESMNIDWQVVCLTDVVREVVREETMIEEARAFDIRCNADEKIFVFGDSGLLIQLARILLDNAIKYSDGDTIIKVKLTVDGYGKILFTVRDEGKGIPKDVLPHIFDRFVRADDARNRSIGGAGLGLSIAKWIAEKHGGHIEVVSVPDIGTKFTVVLPERTVAL
ncbi:MAG: HAMP domain-containing histidine kinase [Clostridiales Family XIII bacterium]|nr:HAMP domain-containing histidine kinase [Clostridiales Family XIII bacterium]